MTKALVREGEMYGGLPCLAFGAGPPLVILPGLTPRNELSTGMLGDWT